MESFYAEVKIFRFWPKTMDYYIIVHGFIFAGPIKASRKVYHLNGNEKRKQMALVSIA